MKGLVTLVTVILLACSGFGSNPQSNQDAPDQHENAPSARRIFRPRLSMQEGLKIAEEFIVDQHIDIGPYYLFQVKYILVGDENAPASKKIPGWHFWWCSETGELGNYVEIFVDMDGHASRAPSM